MHDFEDAAKNPPKGVGPREFIALTLSKRIAAETSKEEKRHMSGFLDEITYEIFESRFGKIIESASKRSLAPITISAALAEQIKRYAFALLKSSRRSGSHTGLVFGGFGTKDLFPTLVYLEVDGIFFGNLKIVSRKMVDIDREDAQAQMLPFAQKEMADRFINGLDLGFHRQINTFLSKAIDEVIKAKTTRAASASVKSKNAAVKSAVMKSFSKLMDDLKHSERANILDVVNFMSKKELGELAHAIVELTSKKRRFSADDETVGGPIDVAIVTRNEGFIWIRRKHYFDREANSGYFSRVFGGVGSQKQSPEEK
jgi:hypothetical protein